MTSRNRMSLKVGLVAGAMLLGWVLLCLAVLAMHARDALPTDFPSSTNRS